MKTALLVMDMQDVLVYGRKNIPYVPSRPMQGVRDSGIADNINNLIHFFNKHNMPVFDINFKPEEYGQTIYDIKKNYNENVVPIVKNYQDAFFNTNLEKELGAKKVTGVVIAGLNTDESIDQTMESAIIWRNYQVHISNDAITSQKKRVFEYYSSLAKFYLLNLLHRNNDRLKSAISFD